MVTLIQRSSLQKSVSKIAPKKFDEIDHRGLYHKTYYGHNLWISVKSQSFCPWQAETASSSVCRQGRSLPKCRVGSKPYPQILDEARKACQGQTLAFCGNPLIMAL
jgi:hypothetical protein